MRMKKEKLIAWIRASRLRTLPLAFSCSLMGSFVAWHDGAFNAGVFWLALITTLFLQILSNLANDYGDSVNGADNPHRVGPARTVQSGAISRKEMKNAVILTSVLAFISGIVLIGAGIGFSFSLGWLAFLGLGLLALAAAITYTAGSKPYGYVGLGDLFVFLFFGLTGVIGTYFLHTQTLKAAILLPATAVGFLSTAVLNLNNMRDVHGDSLSGKNTLVVKFGSKMARYYHAALILGSMAALLIWTLLNYRHPAQFGFLVTILFLVPHIALVFRNKVPANLDPQLRKLAFTTFLTVILFGLALML